jgi:membrane-associated phospholipid phosphatase
MCRHGLPATIALIVVFAAIMAVRPEFDLSVAHFFYGRSGFIGHELFWRASRAFFNVTPFVVLTACAALYAMRLYGVAVPCAPSGRALTFLIATMVVGPGLVVNLGLKDHSHRPRPGQTQEFGGKLEFRPWYRFDGTCPKNCSFVSGEAAEAFWMVAPASLTPPPWRPIAIGAAFVFGVSTSVLRMAFGGHYLSDVVLGALLMIAIVQGARLLFFPSNKSNAFF